MKKVLMLGGSHFQVPSIKTAREMGCYVISCDYKPDNPGHQYAHEYHNVSTTDLDSVLALAQKLKIDGVVCYASDPAALTAAYVAEKMSLPGNPVKSVEILANKDLYRKFLAANGFHSPKAKGYRSIQDARRDFENFKMPVMVKPVDSSGSKGVSKIDSVCCLEEKAAFALQYSRAKRFIIEEYIEKYGYQIAGDGFSVNGELVFRCFANGHYDATSSNPFVPFAESWPYNMPEHVHCKIHAEIQRALTLLDMKTGAYNFDIRIDDRFNVYLMEIGPRNGGNLIPQAIKYATGVDLVEYTIKAALGEDCTALKMAEPKGFWACYMINSPTGGILEGVEVQEEFRRNIVEFEMIHKPGDVVPAFTGSHGTLGTMILKFSSSDQMMSSINNMGEFVKVRVKPE